MGKEADLELFGLSLTKRGAVWFWEPKSPICGALLRLGLWPKRTLGWVKTWR